MFTREEDTTVRVKLWKKKWPQVWVGPDDETPSSAQGVVLAKFGGFFLYMGRLCKATGHDGAYDVPLHFSKRCTRNSVPIGTVLRCVRRRRKREEGRR